MFTHQILDITWKYNEANSKYWQSWRLLDLGTREMQEVSLENYKFQFVLSEEKYCVGYASNGEWKLCPQNNLITKHHATQCYSCEKEEGFKSAFLFGGEPNENAKVQLGQPFYVYLAYFYPDIIKVGVAALRREKIRPIEQDALIYTYIAKAENGFVVQELEHAISKQLGLTEFVRSSHKLKALGVKPNYEKARGLLLGAYDKVNERFSQHEKFSSWLLPKKELEIVNLTELENLYYPTSEVKLLDDQKHLSGNFLGLRGKYTILENYGNTVAFNERDLIGRKIEWLEDMGRYEIKMSEQVGLF